MLFSESFSGRWPRAALLGVVILSAAESGAASDSARRVPAEWEPQEAIWLQWPGRWEKAGRFRSRQDCTVNHAYPLNRG